MHTSTQAMYATHVTNTHSLCLWIIGTSQCGRLNKYSPTCHNNWKCTYPLDILPVNNTTQKVCNHTTNNHSLCTLVTVTSYCVQPNNYTPTRHIEIQMYKTITINIVSTQSLNYDVKPFANCKFFLYHHNKNTFAFKIPPTLESIKI